MTNAFFISEVWLKNNSPLSGNIDVQDIYPFASTAEDVYIQELIGTPLYNRLTASLMASPQNTTDNEKALIRVIRKALMWYTLYDAVPFFWVKLRNIGMVKQGGTNMETVSKAEMDTVRNEFLDKAKYYSKRLTEYLCENRSLFQEYMGNYSWSDVTPKSVTPNCDLAFEKRFNEGNLKIFG